MSIDYTSDATEYTSDAFDLSKMNWYPQSNKNLFEDVEDFFEHEFIERIEQFLPEFCITKELIKNENDLKTIKIIYFLCFYEPNILGTIRVGSIEIKLSRSISGGIIISLEFRGNKKNEKEDIILFSYDLNTDYPSAKNNKKIRRNMGIINFLIKNEKSYPEFFESIFGVLGTLPQSLDLSLPFSVKKLESFTEEEGINMEVYEI